MECVLHGGRVMLPRRLDPAALSRALVERLSHDGPAALAVLFMAVPQGVAYAIIAGLPPAAGIYAASIPAIVASLTRSSRHVITGPTNALSLLVGAGLLAAAPAMPIWQAAATLALWVGLFQLTAGLMGVGLVVDFISSPVVLGYVTGAGVLIGIGQLPNLFALDGLPGPSLPEVLAVVRGLGATHLLTLGIGLSTVVALVGVRRWAPRVPGPAAIMFMGIAASRLLDLPSQGVAVVSDLGGIPGGLPRLVVPTLEGAAALIPLALATTVLSLVESTAVARTVAATTGERLDASREFVGQGLANLSAALSGGYPVSGSLSRTGVSRAAGADSRAAGVLSGLLLLGIPLTLGPVLDATPIACLAGLLVVTAFDLIDLPRIRQTLGTGRGDAIAFTATLLGTWSLALDQAIYLGVGISVVLFLRRARLLVAHELVPGPEGRFTEVGVTREPPPGTTCPCIRVLQLEGPLFFGCAGELEAALDELAVAPGLVVLILRLQRTQGLDATVIEVLEAAADRMALERRTLLLAGLRRHQVRTLDRSGATARLGRWTLFPARRASFAATALALSHAREICAGRHKPDCLTGGPSADPEGRIIRFLPSPERPGA